MMWRTFEGYPTKSETERELQKNKGHPEKRDIRKPLINRLQRRPNPVEAG